MSNFTCEKICRYCKTSKPVIEFNKQKLGKFGVQGRCKLCTSILRKKFDKICVACGIEFKAIEKAIYCSNTCRLLPYKEKDKQRCTKISISRSGVRNPIWKGNAVGYSALHEWVKRRLPIPSLCECCSSVPPFDLANKSQSYKRDLTDWEWLCRKCHMTKYKRLNNLIHNKLL